MSCNHPGARRACVWRDAHRGPRGDAVRAHDNFFLYYEGARRAFSLSGGFDLDLPQFFSSFLVSRGKMYPRTYFQGDNPPIVDEYWY